MLFASVFGVDVSVERKPLLYVVDAPPEWCGPAKDEQGVGVDTGYEGFGFGGEGYARRVEPDLFALDETGEDISFACPALGSYRLRGFEVDRRSVVLLFHGPLISKSIDDSMRSTADAILSAASAILIMVDVMI